MIYARIKQLEADLEILILRAERDEEKALAAVQQAKLARHDVEVLQREINLLKGKINWWAWFKSGVKNE